MVDNPQDYAFGFLTSPFYGLLESLEGIGFQPAGDVLASPFFDTAATFRAEHPIASGVSEFASYLLPTGPYLAVSRASGLAAGAARVGARVAGKNAPLAFGVGQALEWAPFNAAIVGFDAAAGRYDSPGDAINSFLLGTAAGVGLSSVGASPVIRHGVRQWPVIGKPLERVLGFLGPTPEQMALYGMPNDLLDPDWIREMASHYDPDNPAQIWLRRTNERLAGKADGSLVDEVPEQEYLNLRAGLIDDVYQQQVETGESYVRFPYGATSKVARETLDREFRVAEVRGGEGKEVTGRRELLASTPGRMNSADTIAQELLLPPDWQAYTAYPRHNVRTSERSTQDLRDRLGLVSPLGRALKRQQRYTRKVRDQYGNVVGERVPPLEVRPHALGWRRISREVEGPDGPFSQQWTIVPEDDGMWILATELPAGPSGEGRFFHFKTDMPEKFFPKEMAWAKNIDDPMDLRGVTERVGSKAWETEAIIPRGQSPYLDAMLDLRDTLLTPANFKAFGRAKGRVAQGRTLDQLRSYLGRTGVPGLRLSQLAEKYFKPTIWQLRNDYRAAQVLQVRQASYDMMDALVQSLVFGEHVLPPDKNILAGLIFPAQEGAQGSLEELTRTLLKDQADRDMFVDLHYRRQLPTAEWPEGPAKEYKKRLLTVNEEFIRNANAALKAVGAPEIPMDPEHVGVGWNFNVLGSNFYPIYTRDGTMVAVGVGNSARQARSRADQWIRERGAGRELRVGRLRVAGEGTGEDWPKEAKEIFMTPNFLRQRKNVGGFKYDLEGIDNVRDWLSDLVQGYQDRAHYVAQHLGAALTAQQTERLARLSPETASILRDRINQLAGIQSNFSKAQNQFSDTAFAHVLGTNSGTKIANAFNNATFQLSLAMGNLAHPVVNTTSILQTTLPLLTAMRRLPPDELMARGFVFPTPGADGRPRGLATIADPLSSLWASGRVLKGEDPRHRAAFDRLARAHALGPRFVEEFTGQARYKLRALAEGVKKPEDLGEFFNAVSGWMPANSEKLGRSVTAASAMDMLDTLERAWGFRFTDEQYYQNVLRAVDLSNFRYAVADRPQVFTTPLGSVFGNMKTWMVNYLHFLGDLSGMATTGAYEPLLVALGATAGVGGLMALPILPGALDWFTETFADKDLLEYIHSSVNNPVLANGIAFGLPTLASYPLGGGISLSGQTAAPGSHFAHDVEFLMGSVALDRLANMGRSVGRFWDDYATLGVDPWQDPVFTQQMLQGFAPRVLYRGFDILSDGALSSARTGYPMVTGLGPMEAIFHSLGFSTTEAELEYEIYDRMMRDKEERSRMVALLGEAYMRASHTQDQTTMEEILRVAVARGVDVSSVMRSAAKRSRDMGADMFGRSIPESVSAQYPASIRASETE